MKSLLAIIALSIVMVSCSKQEVAVPQTTTKTLFYKDGNIAVSSMTAVKKDAATVTVSFATMYQNNIQKIELMSGTSENQLCAISELDITGNSKDPLSYSVDDTKLKGETMYYMLRYTLTTGDWGYTPLVSVSVK